MNPDVLIEKSEEVKRFSVGTVRSHTKLVTLSILAILVAIPLVVDDFFLLNMFIFTFLFIGFAQGWNVVGGYAGQISIGHAVLFGIGAYATTILYLYYKITPLIGVWLGGLTACLFGLVIGLMTFSLRRHYFAMATLAVALIARSWFLRWEWVGGTAGLEFPFSDIGTLYSFTFTTKLPYYYLTGALALVLTLFVYKMDRSKLGVYLKGINMDQELAENAGINTFQYKMYAMGISGFISGVVGGFYALYLFYIDPLATMDLLRNADPIIITLIGGAGTVLGPVVGAFIFIPLREYTRTYLSGTYTGLGWVIFGLVIILLSMYRPGGLLNRYTGRSNEP